MPKIDDLNATSVNNEAKKEKASASASPAAGEAVHDFFSADEIFHRVAATAEEEITRPFQLLFLSGLAAGLSLGLTFFARAAITAVVPESPLVGNILYPIGFILIVIGRYQLFTENTLTPVTLVLTRIASVPMLLRVWGIVLLANMLGAFILAFLLARTRIFTPEAAQVGLDFWEHAIAMPWDALFFKGVIAGWLVASMVWLVHASRDTITRFVLVFFIMFIIPSAELYHCIIGFCEAMYGVLMGVSTFWDASFNFFLPVLLGNTVGGVVLVAILNYSMIRSERFPNRDFGDNIELPWSELLFGFHPNIRKTGDDAEAQQKEENHSKRETTATQEDTDEPL